MHGLEHLAAAGERVVIVPNHVSYLDGPLIAAFLPGYPMFAIDTAQAAKWWVRPLLAGADIYRDGPDSADGDEVADPGRCARGGNA